MKNKFKKVIITAVSVLSIIGLLPLSGPTTPTPCPPEPSESESGEVPGGGNGCEPLNDIPEQERLKV